MSYLLGIDVGTSGTKTLVCDLKGKVLATASSDHTLLTPRPGWTEQHPSEWWQATIKATRAVLKRAKIKGDAILAVGLSGQMHGSVFMDKSDRVIRPALLWNDQRTQKQCDDILKRAGGERKMLALVGNLPLTGYTSPKILWLRDQEPGNYKKLARVILPKDYVRWQMTGEYATDVADASGMALVDQRTRRWSRKMLDLLELDEGILPTLLESPEISGQIHAEGARQLGLKVGTPVVAGAGDVMSGAVGNGIVETGIVNASLGTSGVLCAHADSPTLDDQPGASAQSALGRVATMCSAVPGKWVVYGCMLSAAGSFQWYADAIATLEHTIAKKSKSSVFDILDAEAQKAPLGCEGLFFLPYLTGERCPHPDPLARGGWIGLSRRSDRSMLVRSLLEGVTFNMGSILSIMRDEMKIPVREVRGTGGGTKSKLWRSMQADIYNAPLVITNSEEGGAYGVALLAGVGAGIWKGVAEACRATIKPISTTRPNAKNVARYARHHAVYDKLYASLKDRFADMAGLS